jgi:hypothetical protein
MPNVPSHPPRSSVLTLQGRVLLLVMSVVLLACGGSADGGTPDPGAGGAPGSPGAAASGSPSAGVALRPLPSGDVHSELCRRVGEVESSLTTMRAVELRLPNRVALDIELGQLQVAVRELQDAELGTLEDDLETPLRRLGYRLGEVELAVEDFRTNGRPQRAVPHVQRDAQTFADELAAFIILARC